MARVRDFLGAIRFHLTKPLVDALVETNSAVDDLTAAVNELKSVHDAHCADGTVHNSADATNVTTFDDVVNGIDIGNAAD